MKGLYMKKLLKRCCWIVIGFIFLTLIVLNKMNTSKPDILLFLPMTGPQSAYGTHLSRGIDLWLEDNPTWKNKIKVVDTQSSPQQSVSAFLQEIAYTKPKVAIVASTSVINALRPLAEKEGIFVLGVLTTAKSAISPGLIQRFSLSEQDSFLPSAEAFSKENKLAFIYSADEYGLSQYRTLTEFLKQKGRKLDIEEMYDLKERNVRDTIYKVVSQKPSAIYVSGFGPAYRNIFKEIQNYEYTGKIFADTGISDPAFFDEFKAFKNPIHFVGTTMETDEETPFKTRYEKTFSARPSFVSVFAYSALDFAKEMMEKYITTQAEIYKLGSFPSDIGTLELLPDGEMHAPSILLEIGNNKITTIEK